MATKKRRGKYGTRRKVASMRKSAGFFSVVLVLLIVSTLLYGILSGKLFPENKPPAPVEGTLAVHFVDVGQGDGILVLQDGKSMLIDTGDLKSAVTEKLISYIRSCGVKKLDYLVLTHPDADHIGGAPQIIRAFSPEYCILPDVNKSTKIYTDTLTALTEMNVKAKRPVPGDSYALGEADFCVLAPLSEKYTDWNDYSVVLRLSFGSRSVLFTGDAEKTSEREMTEHYSRTDLQADVLKVGHHGSRTSTTDAFLALVRPSYAVISCGEGNSYNHPHEETLTRLSQAGVRVYRTDQCGTVVLVTDGTALQFSAEK